MFKVEHCFRGMPVKTHLFPISVDKLHAAKLIFAR